MDDTPSSPDLTLLSRLNALKPSRISFTSPTTPTPPPTDLRARFSNLHSRSSPSCVSIPQPTTHSSPASPSLDELLASLAAESPAPPSRAEIADARSLVEEAERALALSGDEKDRVGAKRKSKLGEHGNEAVDQDWGFASGGGADSIADQDTTRSVPGLEPHKYESEDSDEDTEAALSLHRILDDLHLHPPSQDPSPSPPRISFPRVPCTLPSSTTPADPRPAHSNAEIDSWCAICCADAVVWCRGCAGERYCWRCWREGHGGGRGGHGWVALGGRKGGERGSGG